MPLTHCAAKRRVSMSGASGGINAKDQPHHCGYPKADRDGPTADHGIDVSPLLDQVAEEHRQPNADQAPTEADGYRLAHEL